MALAYKAIRSVLFAAVCLAATMVIDARGLDQNRIHGLYREGEFDKVIKELESFQKAGACSRAESLFAEKHLAVVYAANPTTRELGRYHMYRMLDLEPAGDLLDMFVGEEVDAVFDKVRKEHALRTDAAKPKVAAAVQQRSAAGQSAVAPRPQQGQTAAATRTYSAQPAARPYPAQPFAAARPLAAPASASAPVPRPAARPAPAYAEAPRPPALAKLPPRPAPVAKAPRTTDVTLAAESKPAPVARTAAKSPAWKEPGVWIGGGAALAVVALTLFNTGGSREPAASKIYAVPATASK